MSETLATQDAPPSPPSSRAAMMIVFLVVFIDLLGFGIVLPLLSRIGRSYLGDNRQSGAILGLLLAVFSLMQFLFAPAWGRLSDRIGRRPVLLIGLAGSVVFYLLFGFAANLPTSEATLAVMLLFVSRIGAGVSGATIATAQAVIADCTPPEKRKHGMAMIGAAFGIGFTFGPLFGFLALSVYEEHLGVTGYLAAILSLIALLLGLRLLRETRQFGSEPPLQRGWLDMNSLRTALGTSAISPVILTFFLATMGFASFESTMPLLLEDAVELSAKDAFLVFAYVGFILVLTQGFLYRRLASRLSEPTFMAIGIVLMSLGVLSLGGVSYLASSAGDKSNVLPLVLVALAVAVIGFAFLTPSAQALISRRTSADRQGEILGVNQSASALARILGPILGLTLYKLTETHLLPYLFGAGLLLLMLPLMPRIKRG